MDQVSETYNKEDQSGCLRDTIDSEAHNAAHETSSPDLQPSDIEANGVSESSTASALIVSACDKAGMEGIDRKRIDAIILRESGDSNFMRQQRKRDKNVDDKIQQMKKQLLEKDQNFNPTKWRQKQESELEVEIQQTLSLRRTRSTCVVVDMDSFYISCHLLTKPELKDVPACVGRGMILTSNYCARRYGVRSAMAGWIGDKLVSELSGGKEKLVHIPSNFDLYTQKSHVVRQVLSEYDPNMRAYSLDEVYLDIGPYLALKLGCNLSHEQIVKALKSNECESKVDDTVTDSNDDNFLDNNSTKHEELASFPQELCLSTAATVVAEMRNRVTVATGGLTCSAGVSSNFMLAKIGSDKNKPNGQLVVGPSHEDVLAFIRELPVRKIPGIGRVTEKMLHAFHVNTVKDLYDQRALVRFLFKPATAGFLLRASLGCSNSDGSNDSEPSLSVGRKGISKERTFQAGKPWAEVNSKLEEIARALSDAMKKKNLFAHTITVKVKLHTFDVMSRAKSMPRGVYLQEADKMVEITSALLLELKKQHKGGSFSVRLLGIRCSNFQGEDDKDDKQMDISKFLRNSPTKQESPASKAEQQAALRPKDPNLIIDMNKKSMANAKSDGKIKSEKDKSIPPKETQIVSSHVQCPLCNKQIPNKDNDALNKHIDSCLSSSVVREAAREESAAIHKRKKQRLTDFFGVS